MQRSRVLTAFQRAAALFLSAVFLAVIMVPAGWAQDASSVPSAPSAQMPAQRAVPSASQPFDVQEYAHPQAHFPNPLGPYTSRHVAPPNLANTPRIDQFLHDGKLYISMNDAVALALENNLDIAIARYNLNIADTDVWRAKAGSSILGVNSGVVQNTPGGGVGGLGAQVGSGQGGTSVAAGGAGTGTGGLVVSTLGSGPLITSFDPILTGTLQLDRFKSSLCDSLLCIPNDTNTATENFAYTQGFQWGANLAVGFNNNRITTNNGYQPVSPNFNSSFRAQVTQHLLQVFGFAPNTRYIQIAKNNREISDVAFRLQITTTVDQIENMYWDLVYAYENVRVQKEQLAFAQKTLSDNKKQVEIGTLAPIEVVRAQSTVASNQQTLTLALTNLELEQLLMKNALSRTLVDPVLADAEVIPTSTMELSAQEAVVPTQDLVNDALSHRPDLAEARINLSNTDISNKAIRSALLPTVDLFAYYSGSGLGGSQNPQYACLLPPFNTSQFCQGFTSAPNVSYGSTLNQLVNSTAPDKGAGISINIPIRNRAAQATQVRSEFEYRQAQLRIQQIENQVRIEVRNAQFGVQQNRASVDSAQAAVDLARQSLDAEQKKYALGASTSTLVLQNQAAMTQAEVTLVSAKALYEKAEVELDRAIGLLLDHAGILIAEAERGEVTHTPNIPHVAARPADQLTPANPPAQPQQ